MAIIQIILAKSILNFSNKCKLSFVAWFVMPVIIVIDPTEDPVDMPLNVQNWCEVACQGTPVQVLAALLGAFFLPAYTPVQSKHWQSAQLSWYHSSVVGPRLAHNTHAWEFNLTEHQ